MSSPLIEPPEHVLSTLEQDGSRRWLKPKLSQGALHFRRQLVAYLLIFVFTAIPFLRVGGKPMVLLDIPARQFTILGFTFLPTDTVLLAIFAVGILLTVFLFTALFGRVWCGWACPQTVYMEYVFRPIERLFDGTVGRGGQRRKQAGWRTIVKYLVYLVICIYLANTFLAYFVGVDQLKTWVRQSPLEHPLPFLVMAVVTGAMMFDFCFFREQLCLIACPYGRFQSVLLDQNSLIVAYDKHRGEPRGKAKRKQVGTEASLPIVGDCIDCGNCVTTCPTGIDIRNGLQMECVNCTQCIDACNIVMEKIGRAPDLIRYSSQSVDAGNPRKLIRPRTLIYPLLLAAIITAFTLVLFNKQSFDAVVLREAGNPSSLTESGEVRNLLRLKLTNRIDQDLQFEISPASPANVRFELQEDALAVPAGATKTFHLVVLAPRDAFELGRADLRFELSNDQGEIRNLNFKLIDPYD